jgi:hypothetical protein
MGYFWAGKEEMKAAVAVLFVWIAATFLTEKLIVAVVTQLRDYGFNGSGEGAVKPKEGAKQQLLCPAALRTATLLAVVLLAEQRGSLGEDGNWREKLTTGAWSQVARATMASVQCWVSCRSENTQRMESAEKGEDGACTRRGKEAYIGRGVACNGRALRTTHTTFRSLIPELKSFRSFGSETPVAINNNNNFF